jgi:ATP-dependent DNA helicase RecG
MRSKEQIVALLDKLDATLADNFEDQDLDFKEWDSNSLPDAINTVIEYAVCMANGGGGTVVFGVKNNALGRAKAIKGVPLEIDRNLLMKRVYDATDPKITPVFEDLLVPEGTGRLLLMQIYSGMPPYTDTGGRAKIRVGCECVPLTGTLRRRIMVETGEGDLTATTIPGNIDSLISTIAIEELKRIAAKEAPPDILSLQGQDFLSSLGLIRNDKLTFAGLLLVGKEASIREHIPNYRWSHLRMINETDYRDRADGNDPLIIALLKIIDRIMADNPVTTINYGVFHFEYPRYPEIVLRESLMNALSHADYRISSPIMVKQFSDWLEINNPGGFIGGITPDNILHHLPSARNPRLVEALTKLRLVNRSNLGIPRMYEYMLREGKEPPIIEQLGESVKVTLKGGEISASFIAFVEKESKSGKKFSVDYLLILKHLLSQREIDIETAANLIQRSNSRARAILDEMEFQSGYIEHGGSGKSLYWSLHPTVHWDLDLTGHPFGERRTHWEAAKMHVLNVLIERKDSSGNWLTNEDIRTITRFNREQVKRLMRELRRQYPEIMVTGNRRSSKYYYRNQ